ncbi:MAG: ornithine cyclodeaminase family protein [Thermoleophilia bacterium]|nr:ornithine cyclodeaminase family protein [Thermoleophilia bacterium]
MSSLLYLSRGEVAALLPELDEQLDLVEATYRALAEGRVELPPKPAVHPRPDAFLHAMPAYLADRDVVALKWVAGYPENKARGLPYISGLVVVNDAETGLPVAVMDGAEITAARTAAASGVCVRAWAPEGWRRAAVVGAGEQGRFHATLLRRLNREVEIRAFDPHRDRLAALGSRVRPAESEREAVAGAEVVVTAAPIVREPDPPLGPEELGERWLVLPIDFDALVRREVIESADLFLVDDEGQFAYYRDQGHFRGWPEPAGSVGNALQRGARGRRVACVNLGVGALDAAFAARVLAAAREQTVGTELPL